MVDANPELAERRWRALRGCDRILSGTKPASPRQRLTEIMNSAYDLNARPDVYGDGPVRELEQRVAELLGKPDAAFFPSGTMAQQVAMLCWSYRSGSRAVGMHPLNHPELYEREAYTVLSGLHPIWLTRESRQPTADDVRRVDEPFGTLFVELPLREAGYLLPTFTELTSLCEAARSRGAFVHFDGARLWESTSYLREGLSTVAALADSVYVSFYKTLSGLSGAALAGPADFIAQTRAWRHRYGGNIYQQWPAVYSAMIGLDTILPKLPTYVGHARGIAEVLRGRVHPKPPHTHQFQLWLPLRAETLNEANLIMAERDKVWFAGGWRDHVESGLAMAEITVAGPALQWTTAHVAEAASEFMRLARATP